LRRGVVRAASVLSLLALVGAACSGGADGGDEGGAASPSRTLSGTLTLFGYEDTLLPEVIGGFEEAHPELTVNKAAFSNNDEAVTKLQNGFSADLINVCTEETRRMVELGLLQPIDTSRIEGWDTLFPSLRSQAGVVQDGDVYMVPNVGGTSGIIYNPEEVPQGIDSYRDLFEDEALAGKVTLEDSAQSVIATTALALGYEDPFALTEADLAKITDYLVAHKDQIRALFKGDADFLSLYRSGEIVAGFGYHDYRTALEREGIPVAFIPAEGSLAWVCGEGISASSQNLDAAYAALNWYISPRTQSFYAESYNYIVSDQRTVDALNPKLVSELGLDNPEQLNAAIALQLPDNYDQWIEAYREFKAA
jgi:spermidine/putrescine transport system substrate-binding protein